MNQLNPYLIFNGNCREAIGFYKECLAGEVLYMETYGNSPLEVSEAQQDHIMHVSLKFWGGTIMAADQMDDTAYAQTNVGSNIHLSLNFSDKELMDQTLERLQEGGKITMPVEKQFWGDHFGMLTDRFGTQWMLNYSPPHE